MHRLLLGFSSLILVNPVGYGIALQDSSPCTEKKELAYLVPYQLLVLLVISLSSGSR